MDLGLHLPLIEWGDEGQSLARLQAAVDAARESGFAAVSTNDHLVFSTPWLDGPTALAAGGQDNGGPGGGEVYQPKYYGAIVLEPDGNNVEAVCHKPG